MNRLNTADGPDVLIHGLSRRGEHFIVIYYATQSGKSDALRALGRWATTPDLNFSWPDANNLANYIRRARVSS